MKHIVRVVSHWGLLIHIYVSMAGFSLVLLFAVTGFTLNHQDFGWGKPTVTESTLILPPAKLEHPDRAALGKYLQATLGVTSPLTDYREDEAAIHVTFAAPGHRTLVTIDRAQHPAAVEKETRGILGKRDDLHKAFDRGPAWYWIIDFSSILLTVSSLTGMVTLLALRARRTSGSIVGGFGVATVVVIYWLWVPQ